MKELISRMTNNEMNEVKLSEVIERVEFYKKAIEEVRIMYKGMIAEKQAWEMVRLAVMEERLIFLEYLERRVL